MAWGQSPKEFYQHKERLNPTRPVSEQKFLAVLTQSLLLKVSCSSTVVAHSTIYPEIKGLNLGTRRQGRNMKDFVTKEFI